MKKLDFIKIAVKDYKQVGAVSVSSKHAVKKIVKNLKSDYKYLVEYGAGEGVITRELLKFIPFDGKVVAVELNKKLFRELEKIKDSRLQIIHGNILNVSRRLAVLGLPRIDAVISGVPFSFFKLAARKEIILNTHKALNLGGRFIIYQISPLILPALKKLFKKIRTSLELRNIPPYIIMTGEK